MCAELALQDADAIFIGAFRRQLFGGASHSRASGCEVRLPVIFVSLSFVFAICAAFLCLLGSFSAVFARSEEVAALYSARLARKSLVNLRPLLCHFAAKVARIERRIESHATTKATREWKRNRDSKINQSLKNSILSQKQINETSFFELANKTKRNSSKQSSSFKCTKNATAIASLFAGFLARQV